MADKQIVLNAAEVGFLAELLSQNLRELGEGRPDAQLQQLWRLVVKVDAAAAGPGVLGQWDAELPLWVRQIIHRTFAPAPVKPKPKAKKPPAKKAPPVRESSAVVTAAAMNRKEIARLGGLARQKKARDQQPVAPAPAPVAAE